MQFLVRAAKGQLDAQTGLMLATVQSAQLDPRWFTDYCYVSQLFQERMRQGHLERGGDQRDVPPQQRRDLQDVQ